MLPAARGVEPTTEVTVGPYRTRDGDLQFIGCETSGAFEEVRDLDPPDLARHHLEIAQPGGPWRALAEIYDSVHYETVAFMRREGAVAIDLPITTRMISSPGALAGTIPSDVPPFRLDMFGQELFLTQSSQLYLELALTMPGLRKVYCWDKSFRRERADFKHLPEFTHVEFEAKMNFEECLLIQQRYLRHLIARLLEETGKPLERLTSATRLAYVDDLVSREFRRVRFAEAFRILHRATGDERYRSPTVSSFTTYEEVLLCELIGGGPVFVTHYPMEEVAFYHALDPEDSGVALNADLLWPGYGELIGSGQRIHTRDQLEAKARHFKLNMDDYLPYLESRLEPRLHSGWGMGIERFLQALLGLPFIWEAKIFPRLHGTARP